jgi:thiamine-monophosphate kinase
MNENDLITSLVRPWKSGPHLLVGPGDDCALVRPPRSGEQLVLKTDALVENVHFTRQAGWPLIGQKAVARVVSDFAAMGATPHHLLITIGLPASVTPRHLASCYRGMRTAARRWKLDLAGGEITRSPLFWISIAATGSVQCGRAVLRSGARAGHGIYVTGRLGGSFASRRHLHFTPRLSEGLWLARHRFPSAMMDLSDGLGADLPRLARASGLSFHIDPSALPCHARCTPSQAVNDGEDYELLFTVPPVREKSLLANWPFRTRLTHIGTMLPRTRRPETGGIDFRGFDHLA